MASTWNANASVQILAAAAIPPTLGSGCDSSELHYAYGRLEVAAVSGNATARLLHLPAGKIKVFPTKSRYSVNGSMEADGTLSFGLGAYVNATGVGVVEDVDALLVASDGGNGAIRGTMLGTVTNSEFCIDLETKGGVDVTISAAAADTNTTARIEVLIAYAPQG